MAIADSLGYSRYIGRRHVAVGPLCSADLGVVGFKQQFQILYAVVEFVAVYVVDFFFCVKSSSEFAFHQVAMDCYTPAVGGGHPLVVNSSVSRLCVFKSTRKTTKFSSIFGSMCPHGKFFFTVNADNSNCVARERVYPCSDDSSIVFAASEEYSSAPVRAGFAFGYHTGPFDNRLAADKTRFGSFRHTMNVLRGHD